MTAMPPGRTARLWLRHRLAIASRGTDVLEQKAHALGREQRRLRQHVEQTSETFEQASREADRWFVRAVLLGGRQQFDLAASQLDGAADAEIAWRSLMGVAHPAQAGLRTPAIDRASAAGRTSALASAATAHRDLLTAALEHAAATRSLALIEDELEVTRRRLRALEDRWIPRLEATLHDVELDLAEEEREDMVRARWVAERRSDPAR